MRFTTLVCLFLFLPFIFSTNYTLWNSAIVYFTPDNNTWIFQNKKEVIRCSIDVYNTTYYPSYLSLEIYRKEGSLEVLINFTSKSNENKNLNTFYIDYDLYTNSSYNYSAKCSAQIKSKETGLILDDNYKHNYYITKTFTPFFVFYNMYDKYLIAFFAVGLTAYVFRGNVASTLLVSGVLFNVLAVLFSTPEFIIVGIGSVIVGLVFKYYNL